jgi:tetratricopeptide (TPR) repeat protein
MLKATQILATVEKYVLLVTISLYTLFMLPGFTSPYIVPKEILVGTGISLFLVIWTARMIVKGEFSFSIGKFDAGVLLISISYLLSTIFKTPNKLEAFFYPGTATFIIAACLIYFLVNQLDKKSKRGVLIATFVSGLLLSISIFSTNLGLYAKIPFLPAFIKEASFNPLGGSLPSAIYLISLLPIGAAFALKEREIVKRIFFAVATAVLIFGLTILIAGMLPGKPQFSTFPSLQTSWAIATESLKQSPIFGVGPGNYLTAFNLYRPIAYNRTSLWLVRFTTAGNFYLTLITEVGIIGLAAILLLLISIYKNLSQDLKTGSWEEIAMVLLLVLFAVVPIAPSLVLPLMVLLATSSRSEEKTVSLATNRVPSVIVSAPILLSVAALVIFGAKATLAEVTFKKSLDALTQNDAKKTYDLMISAVSQNSYVDRYHASLAQIDMALATTLASKKDLTDTDRQTITQLVQQAISEGKATVAANPGRSGNWEVLAQIYRSIMPFAQGADQFAIQTYTQAVALDPLNPNLRIALGGTYYALGRYDEAIDAFKLSVMAKSDLANAHYNLAIAEREKKNYDNAIAEMNTVLSLVQKDSADYKLAQSTLDDLQKNKPAGSSENLTAPQKNQTSNIKPPLTLPEDATPPATTQ